MRSVLCLVISVFFIVACKQKDKKQPGGDDTTGNKAPVDSVLLAEGVWGEINVLTNFDDLKKIYGETNIRDERICGPECIDSFDVTKVYPETNREFIIYWQDSLYHKRIGFIRCYTPGAPYHTAGGIKIGTTLKDLLQMNGKPISFFGFGWDYGGSVFSLNDGVLESSAVRFNLDISENTTGDNAVYGDTELNTDMPAVKRLLEKIHVNELFLLFNK